MKKILLAFSGLLLILQLQAQTELRTLAENRLHGPVRSVTTTENFLKEKFGEWENGTWNWTETAEFNKEGLLSFSSKNESKFRTTNDFNYNKKKQLTEWKEVFGKEKEKDTHYTKKYIYDDRGREIVLDFYGDNGKLSWKDKTNYHEDGLLKEVFNYDGYGALVIHSVYTYDDLKRLQSITQRNSKKEIVKSREFEYDGEGNKISEATYDKFSNTKNDILWMYKNGTMVSETKATTTGEKRKYEQREFNKEGDEISYSNMADFTSKTVYTYDSHHNWITATNTYKNFDKKNAGSRKVREIKYY